MATLDSGERAWVVDPATNIALGIRRRNNPGHYLFATVVQPLTYESDVPVFELPAGKQFSNLNELTFRGSECTKDCSGHRAGYAWSQRTGRIPNSASPSFNKGAAIHRSGR